MSTGSTQILSVQSVLEPLQSLNASTSHPQINLFDSDTMRDTFNGMYFYMIQYDVKESLL